MSQSNRSTQTARKPRPPVKPRRPVVVEDFSLSWARVVVAAVVVLGSLLVLTNLNDSYAMPKALMLGIGALVLLGLAVWRASALGVLRYPAGPAPALAAAAVAVMGVSVVANDHPMAALFGSYGRSSGLLTYLSVLVLFLAVLCAFTPATLRSLAYTLLGTSVVVVLYGLLQSWGKDPLGLRADVEAVVSTMGQQNFAAGYLGLALPFALWGLLRAGASTAVRVALGVLCVAELYLAVEVRSFQVLPAIATGVVVVLLVFLAQHVPRRRLLLAVGALAVAGGLAAAVLHAPIERQVRSGLGERVLLWQAGGNMVKHDPLTGYGPVGYATHFSQYRPRAHAVEYGAVQLADAPHSVPLEMFVTGGIVLGLLYLAFVVMVGVALVRGLRRLRGPDQLLLGAFGGAWAAYQVQSVISIDFPALMLGHFVLAAGVLVLAGAAPVREKAIAALTPTRRGRKAQLSTAAVVARAGVGVVVLAGLWFLTVPARADVAYRSALEQKASSNLDAALAPSLQSVTLAPWNGLYWANRAAILAETGDQAGALLAGEKAARRSPSYVTYALSAAQLAHRMGQDDVAEHWFDVAIATSPNSAEALGAKAQYLLDKPDDKTAIRLARQALELKPGTPLYLQVLSIAAEGDGQGDVAVDAARRLIATLPKDVTYNVDLAELLDRLGRKDAAHAQWEAVLALEGNNVKALHALGLE